MKNSHSNHILNTFVQKPGNHMVTLQQFPCYLQQIMSQSIYKSFIRSHLKYCCAAWSHRVYHNSNLKLLESAQRGALSLILRLFKSTPTVALEAELGILLIYITGIPCSEVMEIRHVWCLLL